jgi:hypothetical protein
MPRAISQVRLLEFHAETETPKYDRFLFPGRGRRRRMKLLWRNLLVGSAAAMGATVAVFRLSGARVDPAISPDGRPKSAMTVGLEMDSLIFQSAAPLRGMHTYLVGFHPMKHASCHQMEAHHYCKQVNEDFAQCVLFDSNTSKVYFREFPSIFVNFKKANLTGIEYIISDRLFETLSAEEREFWHPHNYEILSGQLIAPQLPELAEDMLMQKNLNTYGKTFHTWRAKCWEGDKPFLDTLPLGPGILAWSFNKDGEVKPRLVEERDHKMTVDTDRKRQRRAQMQQLAHPQEGETAMKK